MSKLDTMRLKLEASRENLSECMGELREAREEAGRLRAALASIGAAHERREIVASDTRGFMALMSARNALARPAAAEAKGGEG